MDDKQYCKRCGHETIETQVSGFPHGIKFDIKTGKPLTYFKCVNEDCCENIGHKSSFLGITCKRCGTLFDSD